MNKLFCLFFMTLFVEIVYSAVAIQGRVDPPEKFRCQEGCYNPDLDMMLPFEVRYSPPPQKTGCLQYLCHKNGETQIFSCGSVAAGPGCVVADGNLTAPYPECCPGLNCVDVPALTQPAACATTYME